MNDVICKVVGDLLPLYQDDLVSPETRQYVETHLKSCDDCRQRLETPGTQPGNTPQVDAVRRYDKAEGAVKLAQRLRKTVVGVLSGFVAIAVIVAFGFFSLGAWSTAFPRVNEEEAREHLAAAIDRTLKRDFNGLCDLAGARSLCENELKNGLQNRAPIQAPIVVCVYEVPERRTDNGYIVSGGQVLVVEGVDSDGKPFTTDVYVFHNGKRPVATNIVWWSGMQMAFPEPGQPDTTAGGPGVDSTVAHKCGD